MMEEIKDEDLRIDTYTNSSPGCAVRITHLPTGIVVECSAFPTSCQSKKAAMNMLKYRLNTESALNNDGD